MPTPDALSAARERLQYWIDYPPTSSSDSYAMERAAKLVLAALDEAQACPHERCYSEQTMAAVVKERDALKAELFGEPVRDPERLTLGAYPYRPGSGPHGETCKTCANAECHEIPSGKRFWKCALVKATCGPGTDIRLKTPACRAWRKRD